jgi:L-fucose mutarotase
MLKTSLLHPPILSALAGAGHNALILVADGNYPATTTLGANTELVFLNLVPGTVDAVTIVQAIVDAAPVEAAMVMAPDVVGQDTVDEDPPIWAEFSGVLEGSGTPLTLEPLPRKQFYDMAASEQVALVVVSGDERLYANLFLRIGVRRPGQP